MSESQRVRERKLLETLKDISFYARHHTNCHAPGPCNCGLRRLEKKLFRLKRSKPEGQ